MVYSAQFVASSWDEVIVSSPKYVKVAWVCFFNVLIANLML